MPRPSEEATVVEAGSLETGAEIEARPEQVLKGIYGLVPRRLHTLRRTDGP